VAAHLAQRGAQLIRASEANPSAMAHFGETVFATGLQMDKVCYAAVRALFADALGRDPSDDEVDAVFAEAAEHPNAPFRFHRLLGEARKSSSHHRRLFLASAFFGLEFSAMPDDERDRVDMVLERMVPADVGLLMRLDEMNRTATPPDEVDGPHIFQGTRVAALLNGIDIRVATTDDFDDSESDSTYGFEPHVFVDERFHVDQVAFGSLVSLGCLEIAQSKGAQLPWELHRLMITEIGHLVIRAIAEVRPGFEKRSTPSEIPG
jgi:hypothetical protein